jgi:hypothetical protein
VSIRDTAHLGITVIVVAFCKGHCLKLSVLSSEDAYIHMLNLGTGSGGLPVLLAWNIPVWLFCLRIELVSSTDYSLFRQKKELHICRSNTVSKQIMGITFANKPNVCIKTRLLTHSNYFSNSTDHRENALQSYRGVCKIARTPHAICSTLGPNSKCAS